MPRGLLAGKLRDLALLYDEYLQWLMERKQADPAALLAETADRLSALEWLRGSLVWVDGFASFSTQQRYMLAQLAQVAGHVEIGLLMDPALVDRPQPPEPHELFHQTWQTYQQLRAAFEQANVAIEEPVLLNVEQPRRFKDRPLLAHLESQLFETVRQVKPPKSKGTEIELVEAADRRVEVEAVARKIVDLTRATGKGEALRYRQIGVIVRDLEPYHDLFQTVFAAHGIPYFIDRRRGVSHHPLVETDPGLAAAAGGGLASRCGRLAAEDGADADPAGPGGPGGELPAGPRDQRLGDLVPGRVEIPAAAGGGGRGSG